MSNLTAVFVFFPVPIFSDIHVFVFALACAVLSNLSSQHKSTADSVAGRSHTGTSEGWARLSCKDHCDGGLGNLKVYGWTW